MSAQVVLFTLGLWLLFAVLAIINGAFRVKYLIPHTSEYAGHVISTLLLSLFILLLTCYFLSKYPIDSNSTLIFIGITWVICTMSFEFLFGHYIAGQSWERLLADYNILEGKIWPLVLVTELIAPIVSKYLLH